MASVANDFENMKVNRDDFLLALDEVHASFGVSESELQSCVQNGIFRFSNTVEDLLSNGKLYVDQVRNSERTPLVSVLLNGECPIMISRVVFYLSIFSFGYFFLVLNF